MARIRRPFPRIQVRDPDLDRVQDLIRRWSEQLIDDINRTYAAITPPGGPIIPSAPANAPFWLSNFVAALPNGVDMGALGSGILQQFVLGGVSFPFAFLGTPGSVLFLGPTSAVAQDNANLFWNNTANVLGIGTNAPDTGDTGIITRLHLRGTMAPVMGIKGFVRQIIQNASPTGLGALLFANDLGLSDATPYGGSGAAMYLTGSAWAGPEGINKLVIMGGNPNIVTDPEIVFGLSSLRKIRIPFVGAGGSHLVVCNPDEASSGGKTALIVDNNQSGVDGSFVVSGHTSSGVGGNPFSRPDTIYVSARGGSLVFMTATTERGEIDPSGDWFVKSLAAGGYVAADVTTGKLVIAATPVPASRTVQGTAPIQIAGDNAAHDLSANRVWSHANTAVTPGSYPNANITVDSMGHVTAAADGRPGMLLQSFSFILRPPINSEEALVLTPRWLAPSQADGEDDDDGWDVRSWPCAGQLTANAYSIYVTSLDGDARSVDSGDWEWEFELFKNTSTSVISVTLASGGTGVETVNEDGAATFNPGDHVGVKVAGSQVSGTSTVGWVFAFVTVNLYR